MKSLREVFADIRNGENIDVYLTILVCAVVVVLDLLGVVQPAIVTAAILLTLGLLSFSTLTTRKTASELHKSVQQLGGTGVEILDMKWAFPQQIAHRAKAARRFILDTSLNQEVQRASTLHPQEEYRRIRDERVLRGEIAFRRVEVIFHKDHLESVIRRLLMFDGCEFYLRHYDAPPQAIPVLHLMSFDDEHFYIGGFYPSDPSTEERSAHIRSKEMGELLHEYWQMLWLGAKPLNEGRIINWAELKRIGARLGIEEKDFDELVTRIKDEVQRSRRQFQKRK